MRATLLVAVLAVFATLAACVDRGPGPQRKVIDPAYIAENLISAPPTVLTNTVNADLGGKVTYLGNVVTFQGADKTRLGPGDKVEIKHYWKVVAEPGAEWRVFSHVKGTGNTADFMNVDETDMRIGHGPSTWKPGEIIQDIQTITLKPDWQSKTATVVVGMYQKGKHAIKDRMPVVTGPSTESAVIAVVFQVDLSKAPPPVGTVVVKKAAAAINIDGMADDAGWLGAVASGEFPTAEGMTDPPGKTIARLTWDDQNLYVFVQADDNDVFSKYTVDDDELWKNDDIEVFIDADSNRHGYVELQVNPNNNHFDKWYPQLRGGPEDLKWNAAMVSKVRVRGTADNRTDTDQGWDVELAIPWAAVKGADSAMAVTLPPKPGDRMRLNINRLDYAKDATEGATSSWNRISRSDFHALDKMLTVVFADAAGKTTPDAGSASGSAGSAGSGSAAGSSAAGSGSAVGSGSAAGSGSSTAGSAAIRAPNGGNGSGAGSGSPPALTPKRPAPRPRGSAAAGSATAPP